MIYLDHAATCPMRPAALEQMKTALENVYGNASPSYPAAQQARAKLDQARTVLAGTIGADWKEIYFTSGGTEGDNWALIGAAEVQGTGCHVITTAIEHHAVLNTCAYLESRGYSVSYLQPDAEGRVSPKALEEELNRHPNTGLVSVMMVNNEVGTIEPIAELVQVVRAFEKKRAAAQMQDSTEHSCCLQCRADAASNRDTLSSRILFHTDAVQAYGKLQMDVRKLDVDLLSVSAHKIGGPKGIGFLYLRKGTQIGALLHGGGQESGRRAGTENVPAAIGFAAAAKEAMEKEPEENARIAELQRYFGRELQEQLGLNVKCVNLIPNKEGGSTDALGSCNCAENIEKEPGRAADSGSVVYCILNGPEPGNERLASNVNVSFPGFDQRAILMNLDLAGICASGGSACTTGALEPSHVLLAMGCDRKAAEGAIRFTLGPENTKEELQETVQVLRQTLERLHRSGNCS